MYGRRCSRSDTLNELSKTRVHCTVTPNTLSTDPMQIASVQQLIRMRCAQASSSNCDQEAKPCREHCTALHCKPNLAWKCVSYPHPHSIRSIDERTKKKIKTIIVYSMFTFFSLLFLFFSASSSINIIIIKKNMK